MVVAQLAKRSLPILEDPSSNQMISQFDAIFLYILLSVTRFGNLLDLGQLFKAFGNN